MRLLALKSQIQVGLPTPTPRSRLNLSPPLSLHTLHSSRLTPRPFVSLMRCELRAQAQVEQSVDMAKVKAKAKRDSKGSLGNRLGSTGSIGNRLGSAGKVVQVPTGPQAGARAVSQVQTAAAASGWNRVPTAESAASSILSPSGSAVPMLRATPTAGAMPEEIGYDLDPSPKALFGATETVAGARFGCAVTGQRFGHEDVPTRCSSASEGSLPMTPQTPSTPELKPGMSRADWVNRRMSNVPIFQKKSSVVELSPVGFAEDDEQVGSRFCCCDCVALVPFLSRHASAAAFCVVLLDRYVGVTAQMVMRAGGGRASTSAHLPRHPPRRSDRGGARGGSERAVSGRPNLGPESHRQVGCPLSVSGSVSAHPSWILCGVLTAAVHDKRR